VLYQSDTPVVEDVIFSRGKMSIYDAKIGKEVVSVKAAKCAGIKICTKCSAVWPKSKKSCCKQQPLYPKGDECKGKLGGKHLVEVPVHSEPPSSAVIFYWFTHSGKPFFASVSQELTGGHCHESPNPSRLTSREKESLSQMVMANPSLTASQASYGNCPSISPTGENLR